MSKKFAYFLMFFFIFLSSSFAAHAEAERLELIPPVTQQGNYSPNAEGFKQLLFDLYQFGTDTQYTIQLEGTLDLRQTTVGDNEMLHEPTRETISFVNISAKLNFKGLGTEAKLYLPANCFFGQDCHFESLSLQGVKIYGNGHQLFFENIHHIQQTQLFGGSNRDLTGDPAIIFQQVRGGTWEIYGGNEAGTLTGSPTTQILDLEGDITQLCGGSLKGKISGNITTKIQNLKGTLNNYYGGGFGTAADPVEVSGKITNQLTSGSSNFTLGNFVGGAAFGKTGAINTLLNGAGNFSEEGILIGGSQAGEIYGEETAITTNIDTRHFQSGERSFVGGNQYSGTIYGGIENQIFAGKASQGSFKRIDGAGGMDVEKRSLTNSPSLMPDIDLADPQKRTAEELAYDLLNSTERFSMARSQTAFFVEGNVTTRLMGGCVSRGKGNDYTVCGAGYAGVINGEVQLVLGEESLVYSKQWGDYAQKEGIDPNYLTNKENIGSTHGFSGAAGGGDNRNPWENALYVKGSTKLIVRQALLSYAFGGSFSGVIEGDCLLRFEAGQASGVCGAGGGCYRIYGNSVLEMTSGKVESYAVAGSNQDRRLIGNVHGKISGGEFLGLLAASYGLRSNHMIDGDAETVITGGKFRKSNDATQIMGGIAKSGMVSGNVSLKLAGTIDLAEGLGVSAGRPRNAETTNLLGGTEKQLTFELVTETSFSEIEVLGDGAENPMTLYTPALDLKINAPNGSFSLIQGMIKNNYAGLLTHELAVNILAAQSVRTVIGSDLTTFSNRLIETSPVQITIAVGTEQETTQIGNISNFTKLVIANEVLAQSILNGSSATSANFEQNHHKYGELFLAEAAHLRVEQLKTGSLIAAEGAELHTPAGAHTIFLRKFIPAKKLIWRLLRPENLEPIEGKIFAQQRGYPVMTFAGNEGSLTPENFIGFDELGHTYTGDSTNDTGLAVASTIIDYQVMSPTGKIVHDSALKPDNQPLPLSIWGIANDREGMLVIPADSKIMPELRFIETEEFSFQHAEIIASNNESRVLTENSWQPSENYFYQVRAHFQPVAGSLRLLSVPGLIDFGQQAVGKKATFYPKIFGKLEVEDSRVEQGPWQLTLQAEAPDNGTLFFQETGEIASLNEAAIVFTQTGSLTTTLNDWDETRGVFLTIPKEKQKCGDHPMTFHWTLTTKVE
ncbi:hypothetical protein IGI39_002755 [Enterococcus sp. AZ135]|uniref:hypothetical protein n=1 Tax=unclassified Enterococcus TaxID=2608891 RepID=UPI003F287F9A